MNDYPLVLLDFDGVLNSNNWIWTHSERGFDHIAPELVQLVNQLLWRTKAKVVVSSAWRILFNVEELREGLAEHGFTGEIIGVTDQRATCRGDQIERWLHEHNHTGPICILDDSTDMNRLMPFLIRTDPETGITQADVDRAIALIESQRVAPNLVSPLPISLQEPSCDASPVAVADSAAELAVVKP